MNKYIADDFPGKVSDLVNISVEAVIAEVVDNSIDADAKKILIDIQGTNWDDDFHIIVYDNSSVGFESEDKLDNSFRLAGTKGRMESEIGSFHMGMKISTTSKFDDVAVFTRIGDTISHRRINQIHVKEERYEPLNDITFRFNHKVIKKLNESDWRTAVCLSNPQAKLFGNQIEIDKKALEGFRKQVAMFFGITYQKLLIKNPGLKIYVGKELVKPLDPFWSDFTPSNIQKVLDIPEGSEGYIDDPVQRNTLLCAIPWGTISTTPVTLEVPFEGNNYPLKVTGYIIPYSSVRDKLRKQDLTDSVFTSKPRNAGTKTLNAQFLTGFFFYRNDRCIAFGKTGHDSNEGWYNYGAPGDNTKLGVRFKIEFPSELDQFMQLSPTKSEVNPVTDFYRIIQTAWDQKINDNLLRNKLGNGRRGFFSETEKKKTLVSAATNKNSCSGGFQDDCQYCGGFHFKNTKCHMAPCKTCGSTTCGITCEYKCPYCKLIGKHIKENCPLNCSDCGKEGGHSDDEECPKLGSKNNPDSQSSTSDDIIISPNNYDPYEEEGIVELSLSKFYKEDTIIRIRKALNFLGIEKEDI